MEKQEEIPYRIEEPVNTKIHVKFYYVKVKVFLFSLFLFDNCKTNYNFTYISSQTYINYKSVINQKLRILKSRKLKRLLQNIPKNPHIHTHLQKVWKIV